MTSVIASWLIALLQNTERRGDRALHRKVDALAAALAPRSKARRKLATEPGGAPSAPVAPREGVSEAGLTGGTAATSPPGWQGGLGEGAGHRAP